jgi:hypothetical protein
MGKDPERIDAPQHREADAPTINAREAKKFVALPF